MGNNDHSGFYFFTGLIAGSALGLLLAPKTGKKMRKLVADYLEEAGDYVVDKSSDLKKSSADRMDELKEQIKEKFNAEKEKVLKESESDDIIIKKDENDVKDAVKKKNRKRG